MSVNNIDKGYVSIRNLVKIINSFLENAANIPYKCISYSKIGYGMINYVKNWEKCILDTNCKFITKIGDRNSEIVELNG